MITKRAILAISMSLLAAVMLMTSCSLTKPVKIKSLSAEEISEEFPDEEFFGVKTGLTDSGRELQGEIFTGIYEEIIGDTRIQIYSDAALRVEEKFEGAFCDETTLAATNRTKWPGVKLGRRVEDGKIIIETATFTLTIPESGAINEISLTDPENSVAYRPVKAQKVETYLPDPGDTPYFWGFVENNRLLITDENFTEIKSGEADNGAKFHKNAKDYYIFVCCGDSKLLRYAYNNLVGSCELPTIKALGLWFSRYYNYYDHEMLDLVSEFRKRGYPLDILCVDTDWRIGGSTGYDINTDYFHDMKGFIAKIHSQNISVAFNDHVRDSSLSMMSEDQIKWFNEGLNGKLDIGLDIWWYDRNWHYKLNSPFEKIDGDYLGQMLYSAICRKHFDALNRRTVNLSNIYFDYSGNMPITPYVGTHRMGVQWTGDTNTHARSLKNELRNLVFIGAKTSLAYYSSDLTGHLGSPGEALYIRWIQYGALSPIMRYQSSRDDRTPWVNGAYADEMTLAYANMRYRLIPTFYELAYENYTAALPVARRLDFYYGGEDAKDDTEYLLSEDILVAPLTDTIYESEPLDADVFTTLDGEPGITGKYIAGRNTRAEAIVTRVDKAIDFEWGSGSPAARVPADKFCVRWDGYITPPLGENFYIGATCDDGIRIYIDNEILIDYWESTNARELMGTSKLLIGGRKYRITVDFYDETGNAGIHLLKRRVDLTEAELNSGATYSDMLMRNERTDMRNVYIPEGTFINAFTGEEITGPKTIEVECHLNEMPIFIKKGSAIVLTPEKQYLETKNWKDLVIDIYPMEGASDVTYIYEDDGASLDYMSGKYSRTMIKTETLNGITTVKIVTDNHNYNAIKERTWKIRVHSSSVTSVLANNTELAVIKNERDKNAYPFEVEGGSPDSDVFESSFRCDSEMPVKIVIK